MNVLAYNDAHNQTPPALGHPYFRFFGLNSTFPGCTFWQTKSDGISTSFSVFLPFQEQKIRIRYTPLITAHGDTHAILQEISYDENSSSQPLASETLSAQSLSENMLRKRLNTIISRQQNLLRLVSHQLQRPLALIQGYTDLFFESPEQTYKDIITKEITHASFLIHQLLRYGQIESGKKTLALKRRSLEPFIEELFVKVFENSDHNYEITFPAHDMIVCRFDDFELTESIRTILDNAIKYVPTQSIIKCEALVQENKVLLSISDTGPGIPEDILAFLWEPFGRGDHQVSTEGFGLGLPLAKKVIELHGGNIECRSQVGAGTQFIITLPRIVPTE